MSDTPSQRFLSLAQAELNEFPSGPLIGLKTINLLRLLESALASTETSPKIKRLGDSAQSRARELQELFDSPSQDEFEKTCQSQLTRIHMMELGAELAELKRQIEGAGSIQPQIREQPPKTQAITSLSG